MGVNQHNLNTPAGAFLIDARRLPDAVIKLREVTAKLGLEWDRDKDPDNPTHDWQSEFTALLAAYDLDCSINDDGSVLDLYLDDNRPMYLYRHDLDEAGIDHEECNGFDLVFEVIAPFVEDGSWTAIEVEGEPYAFVWWQGKVRTTDIMPAVSGITLRGGVPSPWWRSNDAT